MAATGSNWLLEPGAGVLESRGFDDAGAETDGWKPCGSRAKV